MSEDKIKTVYVCPVCYYSYKTRKEAEACLRLHDNETPCVEISLLNQYADGSFKYKFECRRYRCGNNWPEMDTSVTCRAEYEYPRFITNCQDTEQEILAAKRKLLKAATKWAKEYMRVLAGLERELEVENDRRTEN